MPKAKEIKLKVKKEGEFIPPDGGWGWAIVFAAGFSNLSALPVLQQFGLLFRDKFDRLGITSSQTTTIINMNSALTSCVGLANGPVFKTFTYRQVSLTGATLVFISLMLTTFSNNFITFLLSFSILYGASYGISSSANALALNTYWKNRRRLATGLSWTTTGLGPIVWPHIITTLFTVFGETGAILIISGISLHSIACAMLLQPVEWHTKKPPPKIEETKQIIPETLTSEQDEIFENKLESGYFSSRFKTLSAFSSQYLYNEDDPINPGYEIIDPGIPMMLRANDGYFSQSRQSRSKIPSRDTSTKASRLHSKKPSMTNLLESRSRKMSTLYLNDSMKNSTANVGLLTQERETYKPLINLVENCSRKSSTLYLNESKKNSSANLAALVQDRDNFKPKRKTSITLGTQIPESEIEDCPTLKAPQDLKADEKAVVEQIVSTEANKIDRRSEEYTTVGKISKSLKSFKMDGQYGEKYNKDTHSNISLKNQFEEKYQRDDKYTKDNHSTISLIIPDDGDEKKYFKNNHSNQSAKTKQRRKSNNFNYESEVLKQASLKLEQYLKEKEDDKNEKMKVLLEKLNDSDEVGEVIEKNKNEENVKMKDETKVELLTFCQKFALFFDLDLLKDFTFINLMLGITLANFNELNFSILTPFILGDYGKSKAEVALFMSLLAGIDICVRFCIPFVAGKIGWDNNSFFLFGVMTMAMGRVVLAYSQQSWIVILVAVMIGFGKGLRTVFMALVIPTHVPLHKLPGASGIQLLTAGISYLSLGPVVGWIKDNTTTAQTLHCLNIFTWLTAISWGAEKYIRSRSQGK